MLWQAITPLESRELLVSLAVIDFPHKQNTARHKIWDQARDEAYPFAERREVTWSDVAEMLGQRGTHG